MIRSFLALSLFCLTVNAVNPGIKTMITAKGLDYFNKVTLPILKQQLQDLKISDVSGTADVNVIGKIDYSLTNIQLSNLQIESSDIKSDSAGITIEASGISIDGSADWKYDKDAWIHISDDGSADLSISDVSFSVSAIVGKDDNGHATLQTTGCSLDVGGVSVDFHGGASWLYNLFDGTIEDLVEDKMQTEVCAAVSTAINDKGNLAVESLLDTVQIDDIAEISYALLSDPVFTDNYIETAYKGEFLAIVNPVDVPISPKPFPETSSYDRMMYVWLSDYVANSAGIVYHKAGILKYVITPDLLPKNFPAHLNTAAFKFLLPKLYERFHDLNMEVVVKSAKPPIMRVVPKSIDFVLPMTVDVYVVYPNETKYNAFTLDLTLYSDVQLWISEVTGNTKQMISANFTMAHLDLSVQSSAIGDFSVKLLENTTNLIVNSIGMAILNKKVNAGLALPVIDGLSFVDSHITLGDGYILLDTDIAYQTSFMTTKKH